MYNLHVAPSITYQAKSCICTAGTLFEAFLANNVKFENLNEVITFIHNIISEKNERKYNDFEILDKPVEVNDCFAKIICTCGWNWVPNKKEMDVIYDILMRLNQEDLNRVYYKNNLYEFLENSKVTNLLVSILTSLDKPYLNPNETPFSEYEKMYEGKNVNLKATEYLDRFEDLLKEYVYYHYMYSSRMDKYQHCLRQVAVITD